MKITHNGEQYIHANTYRGVDCYLSENLVEEYENNKLAPGDKASEIIKTYVNDPDDSTPEILERDGILITEEGNPNKKWPLRSPYLKSKNANTKRESSDLVWIAQRSELNGFISLVVINKNKGLMMSAFTKITRTLSEGDILAWIKCAQNKQHRCEFCSEEETNEILKSWGVPYNQFSKESLL